MLPESVLGVPMFLAGNLVTPPGDSATYIQMLLRWLHFLAGIVWIGHLYFFNFVNVGLMKSLDGPTKGKVIPQLMPRALWWFRWGALVTVLAGLTYYAMYMLLPDTNNANTLGNAGANVWVVLLVWLAIVVVSFAAEFFAIRSVNNGWALAAVIGVLVSAMSIVILVVLNSMLSGTRGGSVESFASNKTNAIGIGGALGIIMLLNVWGIIWPNQKRIIAWTYDNAEKGTAVPEESAGLARVAFLASRANTWLSVPMLFFMGASQHFPFLGTP